MLPQCCPNVAQVLPQCCPNVAPMLSQCGPNVVQCFPNVAPMCVPCDPNVAPMLPQCCHNGTPMWPNVATKRWEYPFCRASTEENSKMEQKHENWNHQCSGNVCAPMWPQCGPMLPQCCPNVAPMLPQCCHEELGAQPHTFPLHRWFHFLQGPRKWTHQCSGNGCA